ncbi:hypothetical protein FPJ27_15295 [Burkholderia sp. MS455]|nr:hypothetical protein FPJ27_15295 [Burkholderia sp. MS455]
MEMNATMLARKFLHPIGLVTAEVLAHDMDRLAAVQADNHVLEEAHWGDHRPDNNQLNKKAMARVTELDSAQQEHERERAGTRASGRNSGEADEAGPPPDERSLPRAALNAIHRRGHLAGGARAHEAGRRRARARRDSRRRGRRLNAILAAAEQQLSRDDPAAADDWLEAVQRAPERVEAGRAVVREYARSWLREAIQDMGERTVDEHWEAVKAFIASELVYFFLRHPARTMRVDQAASEDDAGQRLDPILAAAEHQLSIADPAAVDQWQVAMQTTPARARAGRAMVREYARSWLQDGIQDMDERTLAEHWEAVKAFLASELVYIFLRHPVRTIWHAQRIGQGDQAAPGSHIRGDALAFIRRWYRIGRSGLGAVSNSMWGGMRYAVSFLGSRKHSEPISLPEAVQDKLDALIHTIGAQFDPGPVQEALTPSPQIMMRLDELIEAINVDLWPHARSLSQAEALIDDYLDALSPVEQRLSELTARMMAVSRQSTPGNLDLNALRLQWQQLKDERRRLTAEMQQVQAWLERERAKEDAIVDDAEPAQPDLGDDDGAWELPDAPYNALIRLMEAVHHGADINEACYGLIHAIGQLVLPFQFKPRPSVWVTAIDRLLNEFVHVPRVFPSVQNPSWHVACPEDEAQVPGTAVALGQPRGGVPRCLAPFPPGWFDFQMPGTLLEEAYSDRVGGPGIVRARRWNTEQWASRPVPMERMLRLAEHAWTALGHAAPAAGADVARLAAEWYSAMTAHLDDATSAIDRTLYGLVSLPENQTSAQSSGMPAPTWGVSGAPVHGARGVDFVSNLQVNPEETPIARLGKGPSHVARSDQGTSQSDSDESQSAPRDPLSVWHQRLNDWVSEAIANQTATQSNTNLPATLAAYQDAGFTVTGIPRGQTGGTRQDIARLSLEELAIGRHLGYGDRYDDIQVREFSSTMLEHFAVPGSTQYAWLHHLAGDPGLDKATLGDELCARLTPMLVGRLYTVRRAMDRGPLRWGGSYTFASVISDPSKPRYKTLLDRTLAGQEPIATVTRDGHRLIQKVAVQAPRVRSVLSSTHWLIIDLASGDCEEAAAGEARHGWQFTPVSNSGAASSYLGAVARQLATHLLASDAIEAQRLIRHWLSAPESVARDEDAVQMTVSSGDGRNDALSFAREDIQLGWPQVELERAGYHAQAPSSGTSAMNSTLLLSELRHALAHTGSMSSESLVSLESLTGLTAMLTYRLLAHVREQLKPDETDFAQAIDQILRGSAFPRLVSAQSGWLDDRLIVETSEPAFYEVDLMHGTYHRLSFESAERATMPTAQTANLTPDQAAHLDKMQLFARSLLVNAWGSASAQQHWQAQIARTAWSQFAAQPYVPAGADFTLDDKDLGAQIHALRTSPDFLIGYADAFGKRATDSNRPEPTTDSMIFERVRTWEKNTFRRGHRSPAHLNSAYRARCEDLLVRIRALKQQAGASAPTSAPDLPWLTLELAATQQRWEESRELHAMVLSVAQEQHTLNPTALTTIDVPRAQRRAVRQMLRAMGLAVDRLSNEQLDVLVEAAHATATTQPHTQPVTQPEVQANTQTMQTLAAGHYFLAWQRLGGRNIATGESLATWIDRLWDSSFFTRDDDQGPFDNYRLYRVVQKVQQARSEPTPVALPNLAQQVQLRQSPDESFNTWLHAAFERFGLRYADYQDRPVNVTAGATRLFATLGNLKAAVNYLVRKFKPELLWTRKAYSIKEVAQGLDKRDTKRDDGALATLSIEREWPSEFSAGLIEALTSGRMMTDVSEKLSADWTRLGTKINGALNSVVRGRLAQQGLSPSGATVSAEQVQYRGKTLAGVFAVRSGAHRLIFSLFDSRVLRFPLDWSGALANIADTRQLDELVRSALTSSDRSALEAEPSNWSGKAGQAALDHQHGLDALNAYDAGQALPTEATRHLHYEADVFKFVAQSDIVPTLMQDLHGHRMSDLDAASYSRQEQLLDMGLDAIDRVGQAASYSGSKLVRAIDWLLDLAELSMIGVQHVSAERSEEDENVLAAYLMGRASAMGLGAYARASMHSRFALKARELLTQQRPANDDAIRQWLTPDANQAQPVAASDTSPVRKPFKPLSPLKQDGTVLQRLLATCAQARRKREPGGTSLCKPKRLARDEVRQLAQENAWDDEVLASIGDLYVATIANARGEVERVVYYKEGGQAYRVDQGNALLYGYQHEYDYAALGHWKSKPDGDEFVDIDDIDVDGAGHSPDEQLTPIELGIKGGDFMDPLKVRYGRDGKLKLIAGRRRYEVARKLGLTQVPITRVDADPGAANRPLPDTERVSSLTPWQWAQQAWDALARIPEISRNARLQAAFSRVHTDTPGPGPTPLQSLFESPVPEAQRGALGLRKPAEVRRDLGVWAWRVEPILEKLSEANLARASQLTPAMQRGYLADLSESIERALQAAGQAWICPRSYIDGLVKWKIEVEVRLAQREAPPDASSFRGSSQANPTTFWSVQEIMRYPDSRRLFEKLVFQVSTIHASRAQQADYQRGMTSATVPVPGWQPKMSELEIMNLYVLKSQAGSLVPADQLGALYTKLVEQRERQLASAREVLSKGSAGWHPSAVPLDASGQIYTEPAALAMAVALQAGHGLNLINRLPSAGSTNELTDQLKTLGFTFVAFQKIPLEIRRHLIPQIPRVPMSLHTATRHLTQWRVPAFFLARHQDSTVLVGVQPTPSTATVLGTRTYYLYDPAVGLAVFTSAEAFETAWARIMQPKRKILRSQKRNLSASTPIQLYMVDVERAGEIPLPGQSKLLKDLSQPRAGEPAADSLLNRADNSRKVPPPAATHKKAVRVSDSQQAFNTYTKLFQSIRIDLGHSYLWTSSKGGGASTLLLSAHGFYTELETMDVTQGMIHAFPAAHEAILAEGTREIFRNKYKPFIEASTQGVRITGRPHLPLQGEDIGDTWGAGWLLDFRPTPTTQAELDALEKEHVNLARSLKGRALENYDAMRAAFGDYIHTGSHEPGKVADYRHTKYEKDTDDLLDDLLDENRVRARFSHADRPPTDLVVPKFDRPVLGPPVVQGLDREQAWQVLQRHWTLVSQGYPLTSDILNDVARSGLRYKTFELHTCRASYLENLSLQELGQQLKVHEHKTQPVVMHRPKRSTSGRVRYLAVIGIQGEIGENGQVQNLMRQVQDVFFWQERDPANDTPASGDAT